MIAHIEKPSLMRSYILFASQSGQHFDPDVVDVFIRVLNTFNKEKA